MANPAELLLSQFNAWRNPDTGTNADRARNPTANLWLSPRIAIKHLEAITQLLDELASAGRNVNVYRRYLPSWWAIAFAYPNGWRGNGTADIDMAVLEHLENLADVLQNYVPVVQDGGLDHIRDYADLIRNTLAEDSSISETLRQHALSVVEHLVWCADNYEVVGDFQLEDALERLAATVLRVAANSSEENRSKMWGPVMSNWVWPFATNLLAAIPSQALVLLALGGG